MGDGQAIAAQLEQLGLSSSAGVDEIGRLTSEQAAELVGALGGDGEAQDGLHELRRRLAITHPEAHVDVLDELDPIGPAAPAFDEAPWDRIKHWAEELRAHRRAVPELASPAADAPADPPDRLAAALLVLGRCGHEKALRRIESWLSSGSATQLEAARRVLELGGVGIASGRRAVPIWPVPPQRLVPEGGAGAGITLGASTAPAGCTTCQSRLVTVLAIDKSIVVDLGVRAEELRVATCPRCVQADGPYYVKLEKTQVSACPAPVQPRRSQSAPPGLMLPEGPVALGLTHAWRHDDPTRPDRHNLTRLGGAPTFVTDHVAPRNPSTGEPMLFVGQLYLEEEEALLYAFYCSEDGLMATCLQRFSS